MSLLGKLLKKQEPDAPGMPACTHRVLIARWDRPEDMGHEDRIAGYKCESCHELFSTEAGRDLMSMA